MKKIFAIIAFLIMAIGSFSIVNSGGAEQYLCNDYPPSMCLQCAHDQCACRNVPGRCWCHSYCGDACQGQVADGCVVPGNGIVVPGTLTQECQACLDNCCEVESFDYCQQYWYHPYWIELHNDNVKGCYAKDLLCYNTLKPECDLYSEEPISHLLAPNTTLTLSVPPCDNSRAFFRTPPNCRYIKKGEENGINLTCCYDMRNCGTSTDVHCASGCNSYDLPPNYSCSINEIVILGIYINNGPLLINGVSYDFSTCSGPGCKKMIVWYNGQKPFSAVPGIVYLNKGIPRTITISSESEVIFYLEQKCCYDCKEKPQLPATLLYPKVDIETLSIAGGPTIIKDGKILSSFTISPGVQQAMIQVENRGFFTQNDSRVKFEGLPEGVTVSVSPDSQKISAHNIGTYSATFTVGPNVPSGTYKVTMIAYSPNGVFDTITIDFVVP